MQIVIDIPEELYKNVIERTNLGYVGSDVWVAVANGTPLPKGHGDLIDRSEVTKKGVCTYRWWSTGEDENAYPAEWVDDAEIEIGRASCRERV